MIRAKFGYKDNDYNYIWYNEQANINMSDIRSFRPGQVWIMQNHIYRGYENSNRLNASYLYQQSSQE